MKRTAFGAGLFACAVIFAAGNTSQVNAEALMPAMLETSSSNNVRLAVLDRVETGLVSVRDIDAAPVEPQQPVVVEHTIQPGESLSKIAEQHQTTWKRLYDKNTSISDPDMIAAGNKVIVPRADEQLEERAIPVPEPEPTPAPVAAVQTPKPAVKKPAQAPVKPKPQAKPAAPAPVRRGAVAGNTYTPGQCTWHVKNLRGSSLPNGLGNANQWYSRAKAMGLSTGTTPSVGAAGVRKSGNHAVYVTAVHGNGTITVSEMNYNWTPYATRTAVKNAADFYYIY